jgi:hypothetical protein
LLNAPRLFSSKIAPEGEPLPYVNIVTQTYLVTTFSSKPSPSYAFFFTLTPPKPSPGVFTIS